MKNKITKLFYVLLISGAGVSASAQVKQELNIVNKDYNFEKLTALENQLRTQENIDYNKAVKIANAKGMPLEGKDEQGRSFKLIGTIEGTDQLHYYVTYNNGGVKSSTQTARVASLHNGGDLGLNIEGQGIKIGIWDGGAVYAGHNSIGAGRVQTNDGSTSIDDHATHVAGTMMANRADNLITGMAPQASLWANDYGNDLSEMTAQSKLGLLVSNHSYGTHYINAQYYNNPTEFGRYAANSRAVDLIMNEAEYYMPVFAAGNSRNGDYDQSAGVTRYYNTSKGGADLIDSKQASKNAVVVAAIEGITNYSQASDAVMSNFSQWGPTDDFRIKPDISAKGVDVNSVGISSNSSTRIMSGTSMAAPSVTGVFALWQQYYAQLYPSVGKMRAATVKALMAISADEAGSYKNNGSNVTLVSGEGPDHRFGWGVINAKRGAEILRDSKPAISGSIVRELSLTNGQTYEVDVETDGNTVLKAAIAWNDPASSVINGVDNTQPALVNDLDIRIVRPNGEEILPWGLDGSWSNVANIIAIRKDNVVDPIEVVEYKGAATGLAARGVYKIKVKHKGTLNGGAQKYSLIVSGIKKVTANENNEIKDLRVYPNPTTDVVNISGDIIDIADAKVEIFDTTGKKVYENPYLFYNVDNASIDISGLQGGVYMLKLTTNTTSETVKIIKK